jgi:hypothetical protein
MIEVGIRLIAAGTRFFNSFLNLIDLVVLFISLCSLVLVVFLPMISVVQFFVLATRSSLQLIRTLLLLIHFRNRQASLKAVTDDIVDFNVIDVHEDHLFLPGRNITLDIE